MQISVTDWREMKRNSLRGFATIRVGGLIIKDVALHTSHGKRWATLPAKPIIDRDGHAKRNDNGKVQYVPTMEWARRELADDFSNSVIEAVEREYPGATAAD